MNRGEWSANLSSVEPVAELVFLLALAIPLARLATDKGLRRRFRAFPPMQALITGSLALYLIGIATTAVALPSALRALSGAGAFLLAINWWQQRAAFGANRGLPRGSLAYLSAAAWRDPRFYEKQARAHGPVFKFRHIVDPAIGIVGLERIASFMRSNEASLSIPPAPFNRLIPGGFVRYMSGSEHGSVSTVLRSAFTPAVIEACNERFSDYSRAAVDSLSMGQDPCEVIDRLVYDEMMLSFLGVERGQTFDRFVELYEVGDYRSLARTGTMKARAAILDIVREMRSIADAPTGPEKPRSFLTELATAHPEAIESDSILGNFAYALHTARLDVSGLLVWILAVLGENPGWVGTLRTSMANDAADASRVGGLADRIVRETLRLRQSEFLMRRVREPIEWENVRIPAGWHVRLCIAESHRSAESFENPEQFNPDRFLQSQNRAKYSPFGLAPHLCPGEHLTRAMGKHLAIEIARSYDIRATGAEPWDFSGFHWRPNPGMKISLSRVS